MEQRRYWPVKAWPPVLAILLAGAGQPRAVPERTTEAVAAPEVPSRPADRHDAAADGLPGTYSLQDGDPNTLAVIELTADGRFRFAISAGYLDGRSEGRWTSDGKTVTLNTDPRPKLPEFQTGPVTRTRETPLLIRVIAPNGGGIAGITLRLGFADGGILDGYTQETGWRPHWDEEIRQARSAPAWVELSLAPYGIEPRRFTLDPAAGNAFSFIFIPNDFGVLDLREAKFNIDPSGLRAGDDPNSGLFRREN